MMKILFMGSGDFALPILKKIADFHQICAVYTAAFDQQNTRKMAINEVEAFAIKSNIILRKELKITEHVITDIKNYNPDVIVVASYGFLLPNSLLEIGTFCKPINVHPSMLPKWRGAAPIERCIEAGDKETAVCIMKMVQKMDAGDILLQENLIVDDKITATELRKRTAEIGGDLVLKYLKNPVDGFAQDDTQMTHAKKIDKTELLLDFDNQVDVIHDKIRAFDSCGGCFFIYNNERIKIWKSDYEFCKAEIVGVDIKKQIINCKNGILKPLLMQREGKKIMTASEVFRGLR